MPLRIVASPHPFSAAMTDLELPAGGTILDLMKAAGCDKALLGHAHVFIVDRAMTKEAIYIPRENWARVRPKPGMHVSIRVVPGKGGGGGKNPLRTVLTIAVIAASFAVGAYVGGLEAFEAFNFTIGKSTFNLIGLAAGGVTSLVGNAIVNSIAPIQPPKLSQASGQLLGETISPTQTITGSSNRIAPGAPVTMVVGESRLYPMMRTDAPPYTEVVGNDQYLRQLFDLGYGPLEMIEERIGTVPLAQHEGVESEFRPGNDDDPPPGLYTNTIRQDGYSVKLTAAGGARTLVSRIDCDEATGDLSFNGLTQFDSAGNPGSRTVEVKIEYRKAGTGDPLTLHATESITAATTSLFIHPFRIKMPSRDRWEIWLTRLTADSNATTIRDECTVTALRTVTYTPPKIPKNRGVKGMRIKATNQLNGVVQSYNCITRRLYPVWDGASWSAPQATKNPAWAALGLLRLPRRGNAKPLPDSALDLPAWLAFAQWCDRLDQNGEPMFQIGGVIDTRGTVEEVANLMLATAHAWTDRTGDGKVTVGWDGPQTAAVQMFTPRNSWGFEYERNFIDLPHALKGKFINPARDYQQDEVIVYRDGYDENNAAEFEAIEYFLIDRASQVWRDLQHRWAEAMLRPGKYFLNVDMEHLQVRRGKKVRVSNRIMRWGLGEGRIKSLTVDGGGNVTAITLDEKLILEAGKSYAFRIRKSDSALIVANAVTPPSTTETSAFTLSPAIPAADAPAKGDLAVFGLDAGRETVSLIVKDMTRLDDLNARLELVDEAPEIHTAGQGTLPAFNPQQTFANWVFNPVPPQPIIADIVSDERAMTPAPGGGWVQGIDVHLTVNAGVAVNVASIEGRFRRKGSNEPWSLASVPPFSSKVRLAPVEQGVEYEFSLLALSADRPGLASDRTYVASHVVVGRSAPPPDVPAATLLPNGAIDWPYPDVPPDFWGFRVLYNLGANRNRSGAIRAHTEAVIAAPPFDISHLPGGTVTIMVVAVDSSGNESVNAAVIVKDLGPPAVANIVETVDLKTLGWPGTIEGGQVSGGELHADDTQIFWKADNQLFWGTDTSAFWPASSYQALAFETTLCPSPEWPPADLTLVSDIAGVGQDIEYRREGEELHWPADDDFFWKADGEKFWPAPPGYMPWPGAVHMGREQINVRVRVASGAVQGKIRSLDARFDVEDVKEALYGVTLAAGGTRLPITKSYRVIKNVRPTLLDDGGTAISVKVRDLDPALGPLAQGLDHVGIGTGAKINAEIEGY